MEENLKIKYIKLRPKNKSQTIENKDIKIYSDFIKDVNVRDSVIGDTTKLEIKLNEDIKRKHKLTLIDHAREFQEKMK
jgi:hypothetical protein